MAPRPKVPRGPSTADKGKGREIIIVSETSADIDLLDSGSRTLDNRNRGDTTPDDTQAEQPTMEQYR
jgi:hypothetical protein